MLSQVSFCRVDVFAPASRAHSICPHFSEGKGHPEPPTCWVCGLPEAAAASLLLQGRDVAQVITVQVAHGRGQRPLVSGLKSCS